MKKRKEKSEMFKPKIKFNIDVIIFYLRTVF